MPDPTPTTPADPPSPPPPPPKTEWTREEILRHFSLTRDEMSRILQRVPAARAFGCRGHAAVFKASALAAIEAAIARGDHKREG